jgi:septal ring factor EnvC (AmiA/AmiB activator)
MKLCNNPTRRLERQLGALKRYPDHPPIGPLLKALKGLSGANKAERTAVIEAQIAEVRRRHSEELDRLTVKIHAVNHAMVRGIRTKKDRTSRAKLGRNG